MAPEHGRSECMAEVWTWTCHSSPRGGIGSQDPKSLGDGKRWLQQVETLGSECHRVDTVVECLGTM